MSNQISAWAVPDVILRRTDLEMTDKVLLAILYRLGAMEKTIFPRHEWLAEQMGVNEKTIRRSLKRMKDIGLVVFEKRRWKIMQYSITGQSVQSSPDKVSTDSPDSLSTHNKQDKVNITNKDTATAKAVADSPLKKDPNEAVNIQQFIESCKTSKQRHINIIGNYADEKKPDYTTRGQWEQFIRRNLRAGRDLSPYTDAQIAKAFKKLKEAAREGGYLSKWSLETIIKYLE